MYSSIDTHIYIGSHLVLSLDIHLRGVVVVILEWYGVLYVTIHGGAWRAGNTLRP